MITHNKLIRDNIPGIMEKAGKKYETRVLNIEEYDRELKKKLIEEAKELSEAETDKETIDELADVKELFKAILDNQNIKEDEVDARRKEKNRSNGTFDKRLFLLRADK